MVTDGVQPNPYDKLPKDFERIIRTVNGERQCNKLYEYEYLRTQNLRLILEQSLINISEKYENDEFEE